ncbi:MAG: GTP cyclohydrolase II [Saprospiraceae bacterium]|nr:GTP cyclohydrolase II [Saprospiraceae bacterium]
MPTKRGAFEIFSFPVDGRPEAHPDVALVAIGNALAAIPLVRIHSECLTGDVFGSMRCDCGPQLDAALERIGHEGGLLIYLRQEGRGIGFHSKIMAYRHQDAGLDTVQANAELGFAPDQRDYAAAVRILRHFGIARVRLLTNNPAKVEALEKEGIGVEQRLPLLVGRNPHNDHYLSTKRDKLGHILPAVD